jgi:cytochrome oxidase Cu insertion factor (SCO1/SenC/PrrC family)
MLRRAAVLMLLALGLAAIAHARAADPAGPASAEASSVNPRYVLLDARGRTISNDDFAGRYQLITFGYTMCPDVCPTTLVSMTRALRLLGREAQRLQLIFITVDPERDSAEVVGRYTAYFDPSIIGLTGTTELVRAAADHYNVRFRKYAEPGAAAQVYSVDHTTGTFLVGPDGDFIAKFSDLLPPEELARRIRGLMRGDAGN